MVSSSIVVAVFFAISLALSGLWPVPGHMQATFWTGFMNRLAWAFSPLFLGGFFPGLCNPQMMRDWQIHRYFLVLGLLPFIIANVAFPYVVGTDSHFKASCPLYIYIYYIYLDLPGMRFFALLPKRQKFLLDFFRIAFCLQNCLSGNHAIETALTKLLH